MQITHQNCYGILPATSFHQRTWPHSSSAPTNRKWRNDKQYHPFIEIHTHWLTEDFPLRGGNILPLLLRKKEKKRFHRRPFRLTLTFIQETFSADQHLLHNSFLCLSFFMLIECELWIIFCLRRLSELDLRVYPCWY